VLGDDVPWENHRLNNVGQQGWLRLDTIHSGRGGGGVGGIKFPGNNERKTDKGVKSTDPALKITSRKDPGDRH